VHPFDRASALVRTGPGAFAGELDPAWHGDPGAHGGMLSAMLMRAMLKLTEDSPLSAQSFMARFLRAPQPGPVTISAAVQRSGRRSATVSATLAQDERTSVSASATFTALATGTDEWSEPPPGYPPFAESPLVPPMPGAPPFTAMVQARDVLGGTPFGGGEALTGGWLQTDPMHPLDTPFVAFACDAWLPAPFFALTRPTVVPTLDLTIHFMTPLRTPRPAEPLAVRFAATAHRGGVFIEDGAVWAQSGELLAQSRQSALEV
jgi:acyl-coenzyme A thioesterase PaaI-like protein